MRTTTISLLALCALFMGSNTSRAGVRTVMFGENNRLHGQLERPGAPGPYPLVFLLPAGATLDRHGTSRQMPAIKGVYDPIAKIALDEGWAIFRYDRQSAGNSPPTRTEAPDDAFEALRTALELPGVDRSRVVIIAHGYGTGQLRDYTDRFLEITGFSEFRGAVLLSSELTPAAATRIPGDLLVIVGESDSGNQSLTRGVTQFHRRAFPDHDVQTMIVPGADHALCDTTRTEWQGYEGLPGTCHVSDEVYDSIAQFLRRARGR